MTRSAVVETLLAGGTARCRVRMQSACGHHCADCGGCAQKRELLVEARNPLGAQPGEQVTISSDSATVLKAAAGFYLLPLPALLLGYAVPALLGAAEGLRIVCAVLALAGSIWLVRGRMRRAKPMDYVITGRAAPSEN